MIAVIDYGMGNVGSIINMLKKIGVECLITNDFEAIDTADKLILPGVGSFDNGIYNLNERGLTNKIKENVLEKKKPLLGICLGMQLLGKSSDEGNLQGLGLISFENKRFSFKEDIQLKVPHMGWNLTTTKITQDPLVQGLDEKQRYYFVHSYHAICDNKDNILMECDYGYKFTAAVKKDYIYGVQFHPEKSHKFGMALLENFARRV